MRMKNVILIFLMLLSSGSILLADAGPKPSMKFRIIYPSSKALKVLDGWQLQSNSSLFESYDTIERRGPQGFHAMQDMASSVSYGYKTYHKIVIQFEDRTLESNIFENESFNSQYELRVYDTRLEVTDVTPFMKDSTTWPAFFKALIMTLLLELLVAFIYVKLAKKPLKILLFVIAGNLITLPTLWFLLPLFLNVGASIFLGEIFAFAFEAMFLLWTCKTWFKPGGAFLLSFMMNIMSLLVGGFAILLMIGF
jgi:hypothetical protein